MIRAVRVHEIKPDDRERRYLVDRLWPGGVAKESLPLSGRARDVAPSDDLHRWFGHDLSRWAEFRQRYTAERDDHRDAWRPLRDAAPKGDVLLLYAAHDREHNAVVLREYLARQLAGHRERDLRGLALRRTRGGRDDCNEARTSTV